MLQSGLISLAALLPAALGFPVANERSVYLSQRNQHGSGNPYAGVKDPGSNLTQVAPYPTYKAVTE